MRKILIYKWINIFNKTNYLDLHKSVDKWFSERCPNFGNKLWYQGLISEISTPENEIYYYDGKMEIEEINQQIDLIIYPMANIFSTEFSLGLDLLSDFFSKIKIPTFIISCGAQANSYDDLDKLVKTIGEKSKRFISTIYNTGGQFALRGNFTAEFFHKLGFDNPAVVGCPSLFQLGRNFQIEKNIVNKADFKPSFNGKFENNIEYLDYFPNSIYYDQDLFYDLLYNPNYFKNNGGFSNNIKMVRMNNNSLKLSDYINNDRIKLIADMWDWQNSFIKENISFSFGSRIHGTIIALLAGVPSVLVTLDSRTREMAELYNIPSINSFDDVKPKELYDYYCSLDFTGFNKNYVKIYDKFEKFLIDSNIVDKMNENNNYLNRDINEFTDPSMYTISKNKIVFNSVLKHKKLYGGIRRLIDIERNIRR